MRTLRKLPLILAFVFTLIAAGCTDADIRPGGTGDDDDEPIIIEPTPPKP